MERLKRLFGFTVEEDPLRREIEEMRRAAREALKRAEKAEKRGGGLLGYSRAKRAGGEGGLLRAREELESIFSELE